MARKTRAEAEVGAESEAKSVRQRKREKGKGKGRKTPLRAPGPMKDHRLHRREMMWWGLETTTRNKNDKRGKAQEGLEANSKPGKRELKQLLKGLSPEEALFILCVHSFEDFYRFCFSKVVPGFKWGWHLEDFSRRLQFKPRTCTLGARMHAKSETLYAFIAWKLFRLPVESCEMYYVSSNESLAGYHISKALQKIEHLMHLGFYQDYRWLSDARTSIQLKHKPTGRVFTCRPLGVASRMKGIHCDVLICDDLMGKEENTEKRVSLAEIERIKEVFDNDLQQLPRWHTGGQLHVVGNAVDPEDIIFTLKERPAFDWQMYPAIVGGTPPDYADGEVLWPERYTMEELQNLRKSIGDRAFHRQYLCIPARRTESFLEEREVQEALIPCTPDFADEYDWEAWDRHIRDLKGVSYAGIDIGKVRHPSHICVLTYDDKTGILWQRESIFLQEVDHVEQLEICKELIERYQISKFYYDASRGEWDVFRERGELPPQMEPMHFNQYTRGAMAYAIRYFLSQKVDIDGPDGRRHESPKLRLLPDERQLRQLLSVDDELQSLDSRWEHGDAFWSLGMACYAARDHKPRRAKPFIKIGSGSHDGSGGSGFASLFDEDYASMFDDLASLFTDL